MNAELHAYESAPPRAPPDARSNVYRSRAFFIGVVVLVVLLMILFRGKGGGRGGWGQDDD